MNTYEDEVKGMPGDIHARVLDVLGDHAGRLQAIARKELLHQVNKKGHRINERQLRMAIRDLRLDGELICSAPGYGGGYWLAETKGEVEEFIQKEITDKYIKPLAEVVWALHCAMNERFG